MKLIESSNNVLHERITEFDFNNPIADPVELEKSMLEFMYQNNGIGLAANQVGIKARMFVMGHKDNPNLGMGFFNPEIIAHTDDMAEMEEGCLSFSNVFVKIKRPKKIKARYQTSSGEWQEREFEGYDCRCFLHEFDHLEGITMKDRLSQLKWALAVKKANKRKS